MMTGTPESVTLVPISRIEVLNSRDRNMKVFEEIVDNIRSIGLKKPITVTERPGADGKVSYHLVCGEGRLNAFRILGETHIPALVVDVSDEDAFIMSLAENIALWRFWRTSRSCANAATAPRSSSKKQACQPSTSKTSSFCLTRAKCV